MQFAHCDMRLIYRGGDLWPSVVFLGNRFGQPGIVTSQFQLTRASARGKPEFKLFQRCALIGVEVETLMHELVEIDGSRSGCWQKCAPDDNTSDAGKQGNPGDGQPLAKP